MNIPLANRLSALRRESNLSENDLAAFINVTAEKIISWERAESEPTASELFELSKLYHISIDELIRSEQFDASEPISLKKDRPSVSLSEPISSSGFVREKAPDKPADHEIYPEGYKGAAVNHGGYGVPVNPGGNSGTANSGGYGGIQFIGADSERFQNAPYVKADDIKPRDFSHIAYDEPQNQNIKIKTVNASGENSGGNPGGSVNLDFGGLIPPETAAKIGSALTKAGLVVGTTIDKVTEEIKRSVENSAGSVPNDFTEENRSANGGYENGNFGYNYNYEYTAPPSGLSRREQRLWEREERRREKWQRENEKLREKAEKRSRNKHRSLFYKLFPLLMTCLFFLIGQHNNWDWTWLFFLCIPVYYTLVEAIEKRDPRRFAYPVLILIPYFFISFEVFPSFAVDGLWLFASIPFYYIVADHIRGKKRKPPYKNDDEIYPGNGFH